MMLFRIAEGRRAQVFGGTAALVPPYSLLALGVGLRA
jgi:hypothetical protein